MRTLGTAIIAAFLLLGFGNATNAVAETDSPIFTPKVIYGDDNRLDLFEVENTLHRELAGSTVALISNHKIRDNGNGTSNVSTSNFGSEYGLCSDEPFREQSTAAFCSGFLVADDIVVTAGHCIRSASSCQNTSFVFGFAVQQEGVMPSTVNSEDVYTCGEMIHSEVQGNGADFAVIRLDRPVMNRAPLRMRESGTLPIADPLVVIGHPSGLPTKVAAGATIRSHRNGYFVANLDTYGGNSGSAVFHDTSGEIEGILVRGETDFVRRNGCTTSNRCSESGCRGEDVTTIAEVLPYVNN